MASPKSLLSRSPGQHNLQLGSAVPLKFNTNRDIPLKATTDDTMHRRIRLILRSVPLIEGARLALERDLTALKWFDYRFLSAGEATEVFARTYQREFKRAWAQNFDRHEAEKKIGIASDDLFHDGRELNGFWGCRQVVDLLGHAL